MPRSYIEAMARPTVLYVIYSMVSAQQEQTFRSNIRAITILYTIMYSANSHKHKTKTTKCIMTVTLLLKTTLYTVSMTLCAYHLLSPQVPMQERQMLRATVMNWKHSKNGHPSCPPSSPQSAIHWLQMI